MTKSLNNRLCSDLEKSVKDWQKEYYYASSACTSEVYSSCFNSFNSGTVRASVSNRIINGGKKVIYTIATAAMLHANVTQNVYAYTSVVSAGTTVSDEFVSSGAQQVFGTANNGVVRSILPGSISAFQYILSGGIANSTTVGNYGFQYVVADGIANSTTVENSGIQSVFSGGTANFTTLSANGTQYVSEGVANDTTINNGTQYVTSGGTANNTIISTGRQHISSGGTANFTTLLSAGTQQNIGQGGVANDTIISGGSQNIGQGGVANDTIINGGFQYVSSGALASATTINNGGVQSVYSEANDTIISSGGSQYIFYGGVADYTTVASGGVTTIGTGGSSFNITQEIGGNVNTSIYAGGVAEVSGTNVNGAFSLSNGVASNFILYDGGSQLVVGGGVANDTIISSGGRQDIDWEGVTNDTTVNSGGIQLVGYLGVANSTIINDGGSQFVFGGNSDGSAFANDTVINSGGVQILSGNWGGYSFANNTIINDGGVQHIDDLGFSNDTTISLGGIQNVNEGGVATDTIVNGGGQYIYSGGTANDTALNSGGTMFVETGGLLGGATTINAGGMLQNYNNLDVNVGMADAAANILMNGGTIGVSGPSGTSLIINPFVTGSGILQVEMANTLNFYSLSGDYFVYVPDLNDYLDNALVFYDATDGVSFTLDPRSDEIGLNKVMVVDNGPTLGLSIEKSLAPAGFVSDIGRVAHINLAAMDNLSDSLHKRLGELQWQKDNTTGPEDAYKWHMWARGIASYVNMSAASDHNKVLLGGGEAGIDKEISDTEKGKLLVGFMAQYAQGNPVYEHTGANGKGELNSYALGLYTTWLGKGGYFADVSIRGYHLGQDVTDYSNLLPINYKTRQYGAAGGIELGREIVLREYAKKQIGWFITPRAQVNAGYLGGDSFEMSDGNAGKLARSGLLNGGLGFLAGPRFLINKALLQPYMKGMVKYEFLGRTEGAISTFSFKDNSLHGFRYEAGGGIDIKANERWSVYGDAVYQYGNNYKNLAGILGVRFGFGGTREKEAGAIKETPAVPEEEKLSVGKTIIIDGRRYSFAVNSAELSPEFKDYLDVKAGELDGAEYNLITITGHTDNTGSNKTNESLSELRAGAVAEHMIERGFPAEKISYKGEGSRRPIATNDTAEGREQNRRVEIAVK